MNKLGEFFNQKQILIVKEIALEAGEIAKNFWLKRNFEITKKVDGSKVTTADLVVSKFISTSLREIFPQFSVICEEGLLREAEDEFWLIDPIDGTSSFISGSDEFAVNIAFIKNKKPIFGLIHAPLFEGGKTVFCDEKKSVILEANGRKFFGSEILVNNEESEMLRIVTSARTRESDIVNFVELFFPQIGKKFAVERLSSAIKFFRLIEGRADCYLHFRPSMEWDIASGQVIVELMGGKVKKLIFNQEKFTIGDEMSYLKPQFLNPSFFATINKTNI